MSSLVQRTEPIAPTEAETKLAKECGPALSRLLKKHTRRLRVQFDHQTISIPASAVRLLASILNEMAHGNAVALTPIHAELTTQQAADLLNVSRPHVVRLIEEGAIPARMVGTHRRVRFADVMQYKRQNRDARLNALEELSTQAQELNMGY